MISIIVCSKREDLFAKFSENIRLTVGATYEVIRMSAQTSIFQAYNEAWKMANYNYLVYVHEDVVFHTKEWGKVIIEYFNNIPSLGCIGLAGPLIKTYAPSAWWNIPENLRIFNIIQHDEHQNSFFQSRGWGSNEKFKEVCLIDGVFMAVKKDSNLFFDSNLSGFHCYDMNLSLECKKKQLKVVVTKEVVLEHMSYGRLNKEWIIASNYIHKKYKKYLPLRPKDFQISQQLEVNNYFTFIKLAFKNKLWSIALYQSLEFAFHKPSVSRFSFFFKKFIDYKRKPSM
jgi:hypothetical protein